MTIGRFKIVVWNKLRTFADMSEILDSMAAKYEFSYYHMGQEICPKTKRPHIDGYYEYPSQRRLITEIKKFEKAFEKGFGNIQVARGTAGENDDYSDKEGLNYRKIGIPAQGQGFRTDLLENRNDIMTGVCSAEDIAISDPERYHKYARTFHKIEDITYRKKFRTEMTKGLWMWGTTNVGKSHRAYNGFDPSTHYVFKQNDNGWQDGYNGQETVIFNEFRGKMPYEELMDLVDKWPYTLPRRGREPAPFLAKLVIITSSRSPEQIYHHRQEEDQLVELYRRFTVQHITEKNDIRSSLEG